MKFLEDVLRVEFEGFNSPEEIESDMKSKRLKRTDDSSEAMPLGGSQFFIRASIHSRLFYLTLFSLKFKINFISLISFRDVT